jgi:hypothetical protein
MEVVLNKIDNNDDKFLRLGKKLVIHQPRRRDSLPHPEQRRVFPGYHYEGKSSGGCHT